MINDNHFMYYADHVLYVLCGPCVKIGDLRVQGYNLMNFPALLTLAFTLLVSSTSASSFSVNYSCEGLTGNVKTEFENLMTVLSSSESALYDCMSQNQSMQLYNSCIHEIGLPRQLEAFF